MIRTNMGTLDDLSKKTKDKAIFSECCVEYAFEYKCAMKLAINNKIS